MPGIEKVLGGETGQFSLAEWMMALRQGYPSLDAPLKELETRVDGIKLNIVTPNHLHGLAKEHSVPFSFSADSIDRDNGAEGNQAGNASYINFKEMLQGGWDNFRETFPNAADYLAKLLLELAGQEESFFGAAADVKLGMPDVVVPKAVVQEALQGLWDDFSEAFPEAAEALAEHLVKTYGEPAPFGSYSFQLKAAIPDILDKLAQPAADGQTGASPLERAGPASDTENARLNDAHSAEQPTADHDRDALLERVAAASGSEDAGTHHDAAAIETAKAEVGVNPTVDHQAGAQVANSAPVIPDDGFSFSAFAKQGVPVEVAKEAMPAGQLSPQDPGFGTPAGESALPDVGSEDVGNAAPAKEHVVHHGDLAP
jgi:hypothetical protein